MVLLLKVLLSWFDGEKYLSMFWRNFYSILVELKGGLYHNMFLFIFLLFLLGLGRDQDFCMH